MKRTVERAIKELRWTIGIPDYALSVLAANDGKVATLFAWIDPAFFHRSYLVPRSIQGYVVKADVRPSAIAYRP